MRLSQKVEHDGKYDDGDKDDNEKDDDDDDDDDVEKIRQTSNQLCS